MVYSKTRTQDLRNVKQLNCWGSELTDVSIVRNMPFVQVLSLSVNRISSLADFACCKNLQVTNDSPGLSTDSDVPQELYLRDNAVKDLEQLLHLQDLQNLKKLWLAGNPCADKPNYRRTVLRILPNLEMLDNIPVTSDEVTNAEASGSDLSEECSGEARYDEEEYDNDEEDVGENRQPEPAVPHRPSSSTEHCMKVPAGSVGHTAPSSATRLQRTGHNESHGNWPSPIGAGQSRQAPAHLVSPMGSQATSIVRSASVADYTTVQNGASGVAHPQQEVHSGYPNGSTPKSASFVSQHEGSGRKLLPKGGKNRVRILSLCWDLHPD